MKFAGTFPVVLFLAAFGQACAGERECQIVVLKPVQDDMGDSWKPGQMLPVDIARDDANGVAFCAHGGSCIPSTVHGTPAVRLTNCRIGASLGGDDRKLVFLRKR